MCGICGIYYFRSDSIKPDIIEKMMEGIRHRGPDDSGIFESDKCVLGFVRLSIIDLSKSANQPMSDSTGRYTIVFNGEIYNYLELREELKSLGYIFKSRSDTEVLLYSYIEWGKGALEKFNGMFAFAVYDNVEKELFLARDRFGIKPLYYYKSNDYFIFCSELPPIADHILKNKKQNDEAIYNYLVFNRTDYNEQTFFLNIYRLTHGHYAVLNDSFEISKWYDLKNRINNYSYDDNFMDLFTSSINYRLRSDVPVGLCLSGGLDSSSIASVLLKYFCKKDLNTFSVVFGNKFALDEGEYISEFSNVINNMYFTTPTGDTLFRDKEKFTQAHGEPIPSTSPYAQFKVMELASKYVKVTLDGQGADEILAGYHYFYGNYFKELFYNLNILRLLSEILYNIKLHKSFYALKTFIFFILPPHLRTQIRRRSLKYINSDLDVTFRNRNFISENLYESDSLMLSLYNHFEYKLEHLLKWEDRNSMYFSIEARLPFLDYRLVEYCLSRKSYELINKGETKYILRQNMQGLLPEKIRNRSSKIGFDTPEAEWFRQPQFVEYIKKVLKESEKIKNYIDVEIALKQFELHLAHRINISKEIWKWINLDLWFKRFF